MTNCFIRPWKNMFKLKGRANRAEYWALIATTIVLAMLLFGAMMIWQQWWLMVPYSIWVLICAIAGFTAGIRRLHDINLSGWWMLVPSLTGVVAAILNTVLQSNIIMTVMPILSTLINIAFMVAMAWKGTPGPNRFGSQPGSDQTVTRPSISLEKHTETSQG